MRVGAAVASVVVSALLLSGCTAPVEPDDVQVDVAVVGPAELVVGDSVDLVVDIFLAAGRTDSVVVVIEQQAGGDWQAVATDEIAGPRIQMIRSLTVDSQDGGQFRATVMLTGDEPIVLATSQTVTWAAVDVEARMLQHYLDRNAAYASSTVDGLAFDTRTNIPGIFDRVAPARSPTPTGR